MKNLIIAILGSYFAMTIYFFITEPNKIKVEEPIIQPYPAAPQAGREVDHFDWNKMQYVYTDQMPPDTGFYERKGEPWPDAYVQIMEYGEGVPKSRIRNHQRIVIPRNKDPQRTREVTIDHKRYRVNIQPNGTEQYIPIR